mgnify:CR=1 FL=1
MGNFIDCPDCGDSYFYTTDHQCNSYHEQLFKQNKELLKQNEELKQKLEVAKKALRFYGELKNWYNVNSQENSPILKMVIASIDTEGAEWIGGKRARQALKEIGE